MVNETSIASLSSVRIGGRPPWLINYLIGLGYESVKSTRTKSCSLFDFDPMSATALTGTTVPNAFAGDGSAVTATRVRQIIGRKRTDPTKWPASTISSSGSRCKRRPVRCRSRTPECHAILPGSQQSAHDLRGDSARDQPGRGAVLLPAQHETATRLIGYRMISPSDRDPESGCPANLVFIFPSDVAAQR